MVILVLKVSLIDNEISISDVSFLLKIDPSIEEVEVVGESHLQHSKEVIGQVKRKASYKMKFVTLKSPSMLLISTCTLYLRHRLRLN